MEEALEGCSIFKLSRRANETLPEETVALKLVGEAYRQSSQRKERRRKKAAPVRGLSMAQKQLNEELDTNRTPASTPWMVGTTPCGVGTTSCMVGSTPCMVEATPCMVGTAPSMVGTTFGSYTHHLANGWGTSILVHLFHQFTEMGPHAGSCLPLSAACPTVAARPHLSPVTHRPSPAPAGVYRFPDGNVYEGSFEHGTMCGQVWLGVRGCEGPGPVSGTRHPGREPPSGDGEAIRGLWCRIGQWRRQQWRMVYCGYTGRHLPAWVQRLHACQANPARH